MRLRSLVLASCVLFTSASVSAQQQPAPTSQAQAVALAANALSALSGGTQISDVTLTGTGTRTAGSDVESGNATLKALGPYQSRLDLVVSGGTRSDIFNLSSSSAPQGFWIGTDGIVHPTADHNTMAGAVWFFPALSALSQVSDSNFVVTYVGQETRQGASVQHLRFILQSPTAPASGNQMLAQLSATDVYLDSSSFLPVALAFNAHPDNNALIDIAVEVDFSNYQAVQGAQIPFRIQKYVNGTLFLDLTIQNATVNSGLTSSAFSVN